MSESTWRDGPLLGFDLETTGIDPCSDLPVSAALVQVEGRKLKRVDHFIIDPGREVPAAAAAIHGITTERARTEGMSLDTAMERIVETLERAGNSAVPVVGMNLVYDLTMVDCVQRELGRATVSSLGLSVIDILCIDRHFDRFRKGKRTLTALCEHYGAQLDNAHDAAGDAAASVKVAIAMTERFPELVQSPPASLHAQQRQWHREWADGYSSWRVSRGDSALSNREKHWPVASPEEIESEPF